MLNLKQSKNSHRASTNRGFSLVEMLVAVGIFMSIMTIAISSLISIIGANKKAQAIKSTIDSVTFAVENISREMRMGTGYECSIDNITFNSSCLDASNNNVGGTGVRYINNSKYGIIYKFSNGVLTRVECPGANYSCGLPAVDLISADSGAKINDMRFYIIGADKEFDPIATRTQPRAIITISGLISAKGNNDTSFNLQTSVSQRIRR
jgi:Tfp pilus assembly protein PilW